MSVSLENIKTIVRNLIEDNVTSDYDIFTYATSAVFTLGESNVVAVSAVSVNDETSGVTYTYSSTTNKVTISSTLTSGDTVQIDYTFYSNYSSTEIDAFIKSALVHLSINNYFNFVIEADDNIYPEPEENEKNLIAAITAVLIKPDNKTYRLPDLTIIAPKDLPTNKKIGRIISAFKKHGHGIIDLV